MSGTSSESTFSSTTINGSNNRFSGLSNQNNILNVDSFQNVDIIQNAQSLDTTQIILSDSLSFHDHPGNLIVYYYANFSSENTLCVSSYTQLFGIPRGEFVSAGMYGLVAGIEQICLNDVEFADGVWLDTNSVWFL